MKLRATTWTYALLAMAVALPASAAVTLQGTRIVHDASKGRDVTVKASNVGELPAMTQVWIDDGDSQSRPENVRTPFRLTPDPAPPVATQAGPGVSRHLRTAPVRGTAADRSRIGVLFQFAGYSPQTQQ